MGRKKGSEKRIGYILSLAKDRFQEPVYAEIISGIEQELSGGGYGLGFAHTSRELEDPYTMLQAVSAKAEGVVLIGDLPEEQFKTIERHIPERVSIFDLHRGTDCVTVDFEQYAYKAVRALIRQGRKRIAFLAGKELVRGGQFMEEQEERYRGYKKALLESGLPLEPEYFFLGKWDTETAYKLIDAFPAENTPPPDAILAANDRMAIGAMRALQEKGYRIPGDIAVVGFDNIEMSRYTRPPLSTVDYPKEELGRIAVKTLISSIEKTRLSRFPLTITLPSRIVSRETGI